MAKSGWKRLLNGAPWFRGEGKYPIAAYSEFMPPPRLLLKPYGNAQRLLEEREAHCWPIMEYEEAFWLRPGLDRIAQQVLGALVHLVHGRPAHGLSKGKLAGNPYWPPELAENVHNLRHEHYVTLLPLALSRTQDDKGRILWTLFGCSEQGPARAFWKSFHASPKKELPGEQALAFIRRLLHTVYAEPMERLADLREAGFRILPEDEPFLNLWREGALPAWTKPYRWGKGQYARDVKYLLTFRPFGNLPSAVQKAYLAGKLHLLPFPGSLLFWGTRPYLQLHEQLPLALQIPLLHVLARHEGPLGIRVPQSGWLHEPRPGSPEPAEFHGPMRNTFKRTHRWARVHRDEDELALTEHEDRLVHVLFSTAGDDMGLYGKPMARNAQLWTEDCRLLLDGPHATRDDVHAAFRAIHQGGTFGYRFQYPAMRVGVHEVYWHRPLVAYVSPTTEQVVVLRDAPTGYLTAYRADKPDLVRPVEMWPRFLQRELHLAAIELFEHTNDLRPHCTTRNIRKLLDTQHLLGGKPLPYTLARQLLTLSKKESLDDWLDSLQHHAADPERVHRLIETLRRLIGPPPTRPRRLKSITYKQTANRPFEEAYWKTIAFLAEGRYRTKNNADIVRDPPTLAALSRHHHRDLDALGDYLLDYYTREIKAARMTGKALAGDIPFTWRTDFDFKLYDGWLKNQKGQSHERDVIVVIPGRDHKRAVVMSDHYDTAYMEDHYGYKSNGAGPRLAAAGADDNYSATAALMLAAPIFLKLSRAGKLACDIWLVHLTGEEFPADCMGARYLTQCLVEGTLKIRLPDGKQRDLSRTRVQGLYVADMIAHNNDHDRDVFQIAPGLSKESMWLAYQAHLANEAWNASAPLWNRQPARQGCKRSERVADSGKIPATAPHPRLYGEIRPRYDPRSTLYNTDGQIFSDAGVPVVLFMENYDINRTGYHDSHDTMENIDLDYGSALAAIFIESVGRAATEKPGF
jgi:hypothetical protein